MVGERHQHSCWRTSGHELRENRSERKRSQRDESSQIYFIIDPIPRNISVGMNSICMAAGNPGCGHDRSEHKSSITLLSASKPHKRPSHVSQLHQCLIPVGCHRAGKLPVMLLSFM